MFVVKNSRSIVAVCNTEEEAVARCKQLNTDYQTDEYYVEPWQR